MIFDVFLKYKYFPKKIIKNVFELEKFDFPPQFSDFSKYKCEKVSENFSTRKKYFFSKQIFLGHASPLKTSKIKFYCNPTTELAARPPYIAVGNLPKMKLFVTYSNGRHHITSTRAGSRAWNTISPSRSRRMHGGIVFHF